MCFPSLIVQEGQHGSLVSAIGLLFAWYHSRYVLESEVIIKIHLIRLVGFVERRVVEEPIGPVVRVLGTWRWGSWGKEVPRDTSSPFSIIITNKTREVLFEGRIHLTENHGDEGIKGPKTSDPKAEEENFWQSQTVRFWQDNYSLHLLPWLI